MLIIKQKQLRLMKHFKFTYNYKGRQHSENVNALTKVLALKSFAKMYPKWGTLSNLEIFRIR